jgi:hypothetical protein
MENGNQSLFTRLGRMTRRELLYFVKSNYEKHLAKKDEYPGYIFDIDDIREDCKYFLVKVINLQSKDVFCKKAPKMYLNICQL